MIYDTFMQAAGHPDGEVRWLPPETAPMILEGLPFAGPDRYCRLPPDLCERAAARGRSELAALASNPAGACVRFRSDAAQLSVRVTLAAPCDMYHMPPTGQSGFDCYLRRQGDSWRYAGVTNFPPSETCWAVPVWTGADREEKEFLIHFPLYQGVEQVEIGLPVDASLRPPAPRRRAGRLVVYGTSIDQGACASRPGMGLTNLLSRALDMETVNLGFSGNAFFEPESAEAIARLHDLRLLVVDAEANAGRFGHLGELGAFLDVVRAAHPSLPILVLSALPGPIEAQAAYPQSDKDAWRAEQHRVVSARQAAGDRDIRFLDGRTLWPDGGDEYTVDGIHPTDLGFTRLTEALLPHLLALLP